MKVYNDLGIKHQEAIDLKLEGFKYKEIAEQVGVKEQTVAEWFQTKGICYKAFQQRKQERAKERRVRFSQIDEQLEEMACDAVGVIKHNLEKHNLWAAFGVLDRVGFQPIQKLQPMSEPKVNIINYVYPDDNNPKRLSGEINCQEDMSLQPFNPDENDLTSDLVPFKGDED